MEELKEQYYKVISQMNMAEVRGNIVESNILRNQLQEILKELLGQDPDKIMKEVQSLHDKNN